MGTAQLQGRIWGARAGDYAEFAEAAFKPLYERIFTETRVTHGTHLLDVGCGPGLAARLAAQRGARVAGLDVSEPSLLIARSRTPQGDFRHGEMEDLPWADSSFEVVTSFNAFQFAENMAHALHEAARVSKPGGRVAMVVWGPDEACETITTIAAVRKLLPPGPPPDPNVPPLWAAGRIETLMAQAGLTPQTRGTVDCIFEFADLDKGVRGLMSAGLMVAAAQAVGVDAVRRTVAASLSRYRTRQGSYRQRNRFCYGIATA
jgi:SAM-dependent methyltransferase